MDTFPYAPDFGAKCKPRFNTASSQFENIEEETRLLTSKKLRTWDDLPFSSRGPTEMAAVEAFFDAVCENLTAFSLTIDGEAVTGKFVKDSFWHIRVAPYVYNYGFGFQEVP